MKKLIAAVLLLCMALSLCACQEEVGNPTTTKPAETTKPTQTEAPSTEASQPEPNYFITVVDTDGNPVSGAIVQLCKMGDDGACTPATVPTDAEGKVNFTMPVDDYKVSFIVLPAAYTYVDEEHNFYFEDDSSELTITVKKAS